MATKEDFRGILLDELHRAEQAGAAYIDINSGELHRKAGGYPGPGHRMPICCDVMYDAHSIGDEIIAQPPKGKGAALTIRYKLPRGKPTVVLT